MKVRHMGYLLGALLVAASCFAQKKEGKEETMQSKIPERKADASDIQVPAGYTVELVTQGLTFPTAATFDNKGNLYVIEAGYSYGGEWETPKLIHVGNNGEPTTIAKGEKNGPWAGVIYHNGFFYIAEGGRSKGGKILKVAPDGNITALVENLPSMGDHFTEGPVVGPDGYLYFSTGTATNSAVVGEDSYKMGWLANHTDFHDIPCRDIELNGENFTTGNPLTEDKSDKATTGAYSPFGTATTKGQVIKGSIPCSGAVYRIPTNGGNAELVAWGFRNPYGLAFYNDQLYVTENGFDIRGSRKVRTNGDHLWKVQPGMWYGWPDFEGGEAVKSEPEMKGEEAPKPLLAKYPNTPPKPLATLGVHSSSDGIAFSTTNAFGHPGKAFIAQFGDMTPMTGATTSNVGFKVVMADVNTGKVEDFVTNKGKMNGAASMIKANGLERPLGVTFSPDGKSLYVVDFGIMKIEERMVVPKEKSGVVWKITKQ